ncbi:DUF4297 domain-containing protein [soil metagenome]
MTADNPLFDTQREKAGGDIISRYGYQYHWAIYRALDHSSIGKEYAIFIEMHEDVVIANSLNGAEALFEFNQVKTNAKKFNAASLIKVNKGSSLLGKLLSNCKDKVFSAKIESINFVSVNGFNFKYKVAGVELKTIGLDDIEQVTVSEISTAIQKELELTPLPTNLYFIVPELSRQQYQDLVIAKITRVIDALFPGSSCRANEIYRLLLDDVLRKGEVTYDITNWDEFLTKKALTSLKVSSAIKQFTDIKGIDVINGHFHEITRELGFNFIKATKLRKSFGRYMIIRLGNKSTLQLETTKQISNIISDILDTGDCLEISEVISEVKLRLHDRIKKQFSEEVEIDAAVIFEFINMNNEL